MNDELIFQYVGVEAGSLQPIKALRNGKDGALVFIRNSQNQWVLGRKNFYPEGMAKLIGGGIEDGESPLNAAQRELKEEVGIDFDLDRLVPLIHAEVTGKVNDKIASFSVFVFYAQTNQSMVAASDIDGFKFLSDAEMHQFLDQMSRLPNDAIEPDHPATWNDWGHVWEPIHRAAFERSKEMGL